MPNCCSGATCACKINAAGGGHMIVTGTGTATDPFLLTADVSVTVLDNTTFNLTLTGTGTVASPWVISVAYAATAKLDDIPDVNAGAPTNGQVLAFDTGTSKWIAVAPTTAPTGAVTHDASLSGDGSVGIPLQVNEAAGGFLQTTTGLGLTDAGINSLNRHFTDAVARASAVPAPILNTLSTLDSQPGRVDYWDGVAWVPITDRFDTEVIGAEFMQLSGGYIDGARLTRVSKNVSATTDGSGVFTILSAADLTGFAGVLSIMFQETGSLATTVVAFNNTTSVGGTAYNLVGGAPYSGQIITGIAEAWLY